MVVIVKQRVQRQELRLIVLGCTSSVSVDIINVGGVQPRIYDSSCDSQHLPLALRVGSGDVVRVGGNAAAQDLAVYLCAAGFGVFVVLDYQHSRSLAQSNSVRQIERRTGVGRKRVQRVKSRERQRGKAVGAARNKSVRFSRAYQICRVSERYSSRRAGVHDVCGSAVQSIVKRHVIGKSRRGHFQNVGVFAAAVFICCIILVYRNGAANTVSDNNTYTVGVFRSDFIAAVFKCFARRLDTKQRGTVIVLFRKLLVVSGDLRAKVCVAPVGVYRFNGSYTGNAVYGGVPALLGVFAESADKPQPRNNNTF